MSASPTLPESVETLDWDALRAKIERALEAQAKMGLPGAVIVELHRWPRKPIDMRVRIDARLS